MTSIGVETTTFQAEKRSWLLGKHGVEDAVTVTLDISSFTKATHFPDGYIKSGIVLAPITATSSASVITVGPYDDTAVDGRAVAAGHLFSSVKVPDLTDLTKDCGGAMLVHCFVDPTKLPITGAAGALDAAGRVDLKLVHYAAASV